jgi:hypothetical protein
MDQAGRTGELSKQFTVPPMNRTSKLAVIPLHSHHHVRMGLEAQLRQCWAM